ncbi:SRPBCC family protein [Pseudonocardia pini]|uniref:SRPBCC family protein n=1 Tax=Pseudonocardia pini TaxID=2758030 RepID=UPI0015F0296B|nr:SRPBCC family protein [Pseudonocardia pini]
MIDLVQELDALRRAVVRTDGEVTLRVSRRYPADTPDVWSALTEPERLARWFLPVGGDLRVGGEFRLEGNAGGEILACEPPTLLRVTFGGPDSVVEVHLRAVGDDTKLELVHTVPLGMAGSGAGALFPGPGWDIALHALAAHLRGETVDPEGAAFARGSVEAWQATVEASGTATAEEIAAACEMARAQYLPED